MKDISSEQKQSVITLHECIMISYWTLFLLYRMLLHFTVTDAEKIIMYLCRLVESLMLFNVYFLCIILSYVGTLCTLRTTFIIIIINDQTDC